MRRIRTKKYEAMQILQNVPEDRVFWASNGATLRNLYDLATNLESMSEEHYSHHVNYEKNDFGNWLKEVVKDDILAKDLIHARNKHSATKKVKKRIELLGGMVPKNA